MHEAVQRSFGDELPIDEGADDGHLDYDDGDEDGLVLDDAEVYPPNHLSEKEKKQFHYLLRTCLQGGPTELNSGNGSILYAV